MQPENPYKSPSSDIGDGTIREGGGDGGRVTQKMIDELAATKPWARLCSIVGFIGSALMILVGLVLVGVSLAGGAAGDLAGFGGAGIGVAYILLSLLYVMPSLYLFRYAGSIQKILDGGGETEIELALGHQKRFWKFVGVMILAMLALYALFIVVAIIMTVAMTAGGGG